MIVKMLSAFLLSLSSNLDNLVIGAAFGMKKIRIGIRANIMIATVTTLGTALSMLSGFYISRWLSPSIANSLGSAVIVALGVYFLFQSLVKLNHSKHFDKIMDYVEKSDLDYSGDINMKEAFFVGLGLSLSNIGTGLAGSITGVNIYYTVMATFLLSILMIKWGQVMGDFIFSHILGKYALSIAGGLLIVVGIIEFLN